MATLGTSSVTQFIFSELVIALNAGIFKDNLAEILGRAVSVGHNKFASVVSCNACNALTGSASLALQRVYKILDGTSVALIQPKLVCAFTVSAVSALATHEGGYHEQTHHEQAQERGEFRFHSQCFSFFPMILFFIF
jgi:hypothetical protein